MQRKDLRDRHAGSLLEMRVQVEEGPTKLLSQQARSVTISRKEMPRIAFGTLVESGAIAAGTLLMDKQRRVSAVVGADGSVSAGNLRGSIHKIGAALQNAPSCNGWTFWHFEQGGALVPIDVLRQPPPA